MKKLLTSATARFALRTCLIALATCIPVNTAPAEVIQTCTPTATEHGELVAGGWECK